MAKILLVEDDEVSALLMMSLLEDQNHTVQHANSPGRALEITETFIPELLICDWRLDGSIEGGELARRIQRRNPSLKVIFVSGIEESLIRAEARDVNITSVYTKPCDYEAVADEVSQLGAAR